MCVWICGGDSKAARCRPLLVTARLRPDPPRWTRLSGAPCCSPPELPAPVLAYLCAALGLWLPPASAAAAAAGRGRPERGAGAACSGARTSLWRGRPGRGGRAWTRRRGRSTLGALWSILLRLGRRPMSDGEAGEQRVTSPPSDRHRAASEERRVPSASSLSTQRLHTQPAAAAAMATPHSSATGRQRVGYKHTRRAELARRSWDSCL